MTHSSLREIIEGTIGSYRRAGRENQARYLEENALPALDGLVEQLEVMQRERDTWKGAAEYQPSSWSDLWGKERERADELQEQLEAAQASLYAFQNCMERNGADCNEHLADAMRLVGASNPASRSGDE